MKLTKHIFLIGFMGCGKSTNAAYLSKMTGAEQMEMDQAIVKQQKMEITDKKAVKLRFLINIPCF